MRENRCETCACWERIHEKLKLGTCHRMPPRWEPRLTWNHEDPEKAPHYELVTPATFVRTMADDFCFEHRKAKEETQEKQGFLRND